MARKIWLITGASRGLGAEIAKAVLDADDNLVATARDAQALNRLGSRDNLLALSMDVTNEAQVKAGKTRVFALERNHQQPGDPAKLAAAVLELANAAEPPLRLPLGRDALERFRDKNAFVAGETAKWRALAESTDYIGPA
ncbi:MAG: SDR family NAD(P)-dependent oxidoreductase [Candidatus Binatia bacterium]